MPSWRFTVGSILAAAALGIGIFLGLYVSTAVPEPDDFALAQKLQFIMTTEKLNSDHYRK
ncbi:hypothetical protein RQN30_07790 [Arcanobacterium hippocoleae]